MKIYTKAGDDGSTTLLGSGRLPKNDPRIEAYGAVDETNAAVGTARAFLPSAAHAALGWLDAIQSDLFVIGSLLATPPATTPVTTLSGDRIQALEAAIDQMESEIPPLKNFILPQGPPCVALLHLARTICRRAERRVVTIVVGQSVEPTVIPYLNRLSDFLFVTARWVNFRESGMETAWINPTGTKSAPQVQEPSNDIKEDRLTSSLRKLEEERKRRGSLFEQTAADLQKKKEKAQQLFSSTVKKIQEDGGKVEAEIRPIDLD